MNRLVPSGNVRPALEELESRCVLAAPNAAGFVTGLYQNILDRAPEATGLQFWVGQLNAGANRTEVVRTFWNSDERHLLMLDDAYRIHLDRAPDAAGQAAWLALLRAGVDDNDVLRAFVASPEYQKLHSADADFLGSLYTDLLGRDASAGELQAGATALAAGVTRADLVAGVLRSVEFAAVRIMTQYESVLQRAATADDVLVWLPVAQQTGDLAALAVPLLASEEFFQTSLQRAALPSVALFRDSAETVFQIADLLHAADPSNPKPPFRHFVANATESHEDLLRGRYPVVAMSLDDVISLSRSNDPNAKHVVFFSGVHRGFLKLIARPGINSIEDLRGKTVAIDTDTGYAAALFAVLRQHGLVRGRDFNVVYAGATNVRYTKLLAGQFDATLLGTPFTVLAEQKGFRSLARPIDALGGYQGVVLAALRPWLATHTAEARRLAKQFNATVRWAQNSVNRPAVIALVAQTLAGQGAAAAAPAVAAELFGPTSEFNPNGQLAAGDIAEVIRLYNSSRGGQLPADAIARIYVPIGD